MKMLVFLETLINGKIIIEDFGYLQLLSDQESAIETENPDSYIVGTLVRNVSENRSYHFPVGNKSVNRSAELSDFSFSGNVAVAFNPDIPDYSIPNAEVVDELGWEITSLEGNGNNQFLLNLFGEDIGKNSKIAFVGQPANIPVINQVSSYNINGYLQSESPMGYGTYFVVNISGIVYPNFLSTNSRYDINAFVIPDRDDYDRVKLIVFNRRGKEVFSSVDYVQEFRASNYTSGTYFYEITLIKGQKEIVRYKFIELRNEN